MYKIELVICYLIVVDIQLVDLLESTTFNETFIISVKVNQFIPKWAVTYKPFNVNWSTQSIFVWYRSRDTCNDLEVGPGTVPPWKVHIYQYFKDAC